VTAGGGVAPVGAWRCQTILEWPDVDTRARLAPGWQWAKLVTGVVNSDGTANDPRRRLVRRGGGLVSPWCAGPQDLAEASDELFERLRPAHNYRSNLRIRIRVPDVTDRLDVLVRVGALTPYLYAVVDRVDPLHELMANQPDSAAGRAAAVRLASTMGERHHLHLPHVQEVRARARTLRELLAPEPQRGPWELVNLRRLPVDGSIELRCFADPLDPGELHAAAGFSQQWLHAAITGGDLMSAVTVWAPHLPRQRRFEHHLEAGWQATNFRHHRRADVAAALAARRTRP